MNVLSNGLFNNGRRCADQIIFHLSTKGFQSRSRTSLLVGFLTNCIHRSSHAPNFRKFFCRPINLYRVLVTDLWIYLAILHCSKEQVMLQQVVFLTEGRQNVKKPSTFFDFRQVVSKNYFG